MTLRPGLWIIFTLLVSAVLPAGAQDLLVRITPQVVEADRSVSWEEPLSKVTPAGFPVVVNIDAEGLAIRISVTPFPRDGEYLLVVQGEVRRTGTSGVRLASSVQSLLVPPGEPIAYFPLGRAGAGEGRQMLVLIRVEARGE